MNINIPTSLESSILDAVRSGRYASLDDAMAAAAFLLVQHLEQEQSRTKRAARLAVAISLGTLAWTFVIGFAIFNFSQRITWVLLKEQTEEIVYFAYAFSVASAITAVVAYAAAGRRRWAIGACATNVVLLAASLPILYWFSCRNITLNSAWAWSVWSSAQDCAAYGSFLGVCTAFIVSGLILASVVAERHTKRWQFGLFVAVAVAVLGMWVLPVVAYGLPELAFPYLRWNHRHLWDTSLFAAGMTGAGTGSLAGAVVAGLLARCFNAEARG
jgi:Arc/MetJ-type ribon-helix-helix transcriptional regulator